MTAAGSSSATACRSAAELGIRVLEIGIDQLVEELQVAAGDVEQALERRHVEGRLGHETTSSWSMPSFTPSTA